MNAPLSDASGYGLGVVILGAGRSTRMGQPKLLLDWGGTSILGHLIEQWRALGAGQIGVVCAADCLVIPAELDRLDFPREDRISNPAPERGMFSSIQCAARWRGWKPGLTHWALVLGDQPHLCERTLRTLLGFSAGEPQVICQLARLGHGRHPVLLPKTAFLALADSTAANLREFLSGQTVALREIDDPGLDLDIDRPDDYQRALKLKSCGSTPLTRE